MLTEIKAFEGLANDFIAPVSKNALQQFCSQLEGYRNAETQGRFVWQIPETQPLTTIGTTSYEPGGGGQRVLVGQISAIWEIKKEAPLKKSMPAKYFSVVGLASRRAEQSRTAAYLDKAKLRAFPNLRSV